MRCGLCPQRVHRSLYGTVIYGPLQEGTVKIRPTTKKETNDGLRLGLPWTLA